MGGGRGGSTNNTNKNGGGGMTASGLVSIPSGSRKIVQSLKEIVNCPELEIYAMLKECNMDPNETVNRLLSQDPFHEVKSKREKKKENKETSEFRPRNASGISNRGRPTGDRFAGRGSSQYSTSDSSALHSQPAYKKDDGLISHANSLSSAPGLGGHTIHRQPLPNSEVTVDEDKFPVLRMIDYSSSVSQPSSGNQASWMGGPGQMSMADIVKVGKPISKTPNSFHNINQGQGLMSRVNEDHNPKVSMDNFESGVSSVHHVSVDDEWPLVEQSLSASVPSVSKIPVDPVLHADSSNLPSITTNRPQGEEAQQTEEEPIEEPGASHILSASVSDRKMPEDTSGGSVIVEDDLYQNSVSYQPQFRMQQEEVTNNSIPVASLTANLQQLSIQKEDRGFPAERLGPSVVIPDHLQAQSVDCSHLSFGSFGSGVTPAFSGPSASLSVISNPEEPSRDVGASSVSQVDNRRSEYYIEDSLRNESDAELFHRTGAGGYDSAVPPPEPLKVENPELEHGRQYAFASSTPGYAFENSQHANVEMNQAQANSQMQNLVSFTNSIPSYTDSLPNALLAGNIPSGRESDIPYSPFPVAQSVAAKYGSAASSISGPMAEALKTASFSSTQSIPQTISGGSIATGPALPQHLSAHPYSQHALPLHFPNMISYPLFTRGYTYGPPNYQQTFSGESTYHQNLAAQYKNNVSVSSLSQSASIASGYGALRGSTTNVQGNFLMDPHTAPSAANLTYEQLLNAQFKDSNRLMSLQQNDNTGSWLQGPGSRTMSSLPSAYYGYQGHSQQPAAGYRQAQQPSQIQGGLGYPNFYHSQTGMSLEHQQQNPRDGPQVQSQQSQQQIWQNNY